MRYTLIMYLLAYIIIAAPGMGDTSDIENASEIVEKWINDAYIGGLDISSVYIYPPDGNVADYLITSENKLSDTLHKAVIIVQLAPGMKFINSTKAPQRTPSPSDDPQSLTWIEEELKPGPENRFSVILQVDTNGQNNHSDLEKTSAGAAALITETKERKISEGPVSSSAFKGAL
jgi:hypothetical protein